MAEDFVKQLFDFINGSAEHHLKSAENLKGFLTFVANMQSNVTVSNKILAYGYNPNATDIHTKEEWEQSGITVQDENAVIYNLQHSPDRKQKYVERVMYDISSTNATPHSFERFPDAGFFAERLIISAPCPIRYKAGPISGSRKACFDAEKGIIEVTHGFRDEEQACHGLLREFAHFYLCENEHRDKRGKAEKTKPYERDKHGVEAQAVSYAVCVRYGINPPEIDVLSPPEGEAEDKRRILEGLDYSIFRISQRIEESGRQQRRFLSEETGENQSGGRTQERG